MSYEIAFIGLGVMGYPMAGHLAAAGHRVCVYNRTASKAGAWVRRFGGSSATTPGEAAARADFVFTCVGNDDDLRDVAHGAQGILAGLRPGAVFVDHTTASSGIARQLAGAAAARDALFLDGPVSGGQAGAESGQLSVMAGGESAAFERARPVMDCYAKACTLIGPVGSGQLCKMVNQICLAGLIQGLSEALKFAQANALDTAAVLEAVSQGAAQSWQMDNRAHTMLAREFDFGFALDWMRKDLGLALNQAAAVGATLPVTTMVDGYYARLQAAGHGRWDTSALIALLDPVGRQAPTSSGASR